MNDLVVKNLYVNINMILHYSVPLVKMQHNLMHEI